MPEKIIATEEPASFADLPIQPTGSGVQDLEIAYEQMALSQGSPASSADGLDAPIPTEEDEAAMVSAAHPS